MVCNEAWIRHKRIVSMGVCFTIGNFIVAMLSSFIYGFNPITASKIFLMLELNLFSIPLLWSWSFVWWINYIILLEIFLQLAYFMDLDSGEELGKKGIRYNVCIPDCTHIGILLTDEKILDCKKI